MTIFELSTTDGKIVAVITPVKGQTVEFEEMVYEIRDIISKRLKEPINLDEKSL